ncbi:MAG: Ig-like domain-containing protein [Eubacterium sp.]|nr:Ig-like domain-containing protein [Eubacterium sp.]
MKIIKKITSLMLIAALLVGLLPMMELGRGNGVHAATADEIVKDAASWVGVTPYSLGGTDLYGGCDCSGFVCAIFKRHGLDLINEYGVRDAEQMYVLAHKYGTVVGNTVDVVKDGYIIVFDEDGGEFCAHVGICSHDSAGNKTFIHAANSREGTKIDYISDFLRWGYSIRGIIKPNIVTGSDDDYKKAVSTKNPGYPYKNQKKAINTEDTNAVSWLQTALNNVIYTNLNVDGVFGTETVDAVKKFQNACGIVATGTPDLETVTAIKNMFLEGQKITKLKLNQANVKSLQVSMGVKLTAKIIPASAEDVVLQWKSSDPKIAKVSQVGKVTALKVGKVTITATAPNGVEVKRKLTIIPKVRRNQFFKGFYYDENGSKTSIAKCRWKKDAIGKWYGNDTWYAKNQWMYIDNYWYYFNSKGYACQKGWVKIRGVRYYLNPQNGRMASNEWIQGRFVSKDGSQTYKYKGKWFETEDGYWMFKDSSGWYAKNATVKIDGVSYKFNKNGICTNIN